MKCLFVHDHPFQVADNGDVFSPGKITYSVLARYLRHAEGVVVFGRRTTYGPQSSLVMSSGPNVSFCLIERAATLRQAVRYLGEARSRLRRLIEDVDVVIARVPSMYGNIAADLAMRSHKPMAVEVVACAWDALWNYGTLAGKVFAPYMFLKSRQVVRNAPKALYVTDRFLQARYPSGGTMVACSDVEVPEPDLKTLTNRLRKASVSPSIFKLGLIGNVGNSIKGIGVTLNAFKLLQTEFDERLCIEIVGAGDQRHWIARARLLGLNNVRFLGALPAGAKVREWLDTIDVYVQPSFQEGLPRALAEAMSRGCPALGSRVGGIPELLSSENLHAPGNAKEFASGIRRALSDGGWILAQARRNFELARRFAPSVLEPTRDRFLTELFSLARH